MASGERRVLQQQLLAPATARQSPTRPSRMSSGGVSDVRAPDLDVVLGQYQRALMTQQSEPGASRSSCSPELSPVPTSPQQMPPTAASPVCDASGLDDAAHGRLHHPLNARLIVPSVDAGSPASPVASSSALSTRADGSASYKPPYLLASASRQIRQIAQRLDEGEARHGTQLTALALATFASYVGLGYMGICFSEASVPAVVCPATLANHSFLPSDAHWALLTPTLLVLALVLTIGLSGSLAARLRAIARERRAKERLALKRVQRANGADVEAARGDAVVSADLERVMGHVHDVSLHVSLRFDHLSYRLPSGERTAVLSDASGHVAAGEVTAVMGPSGCGKSTLIQLLSGKLKPSSGAIYVNGRQGSLRELHKLIAFVPQDDVMLTTLSVVELLWLSARLRMPMGISDRRLYTWVHTVIDILGLLPWKHALVGDIERRGLSGGQRKRVNIGIELVADPSLI